jgi:NAD-dependent SIR2 family protein deacetylase
MIYRESAKVIKNSNILVITAGAGIGVDSGMPDFRGPEGFWNIFKPFKDQFTFRECANPMFQMR